MTKKRFCILFLVFTALFLFCTDSSPLIRYRGIDSSVYFTVGRGILGGKTVYADLFDNKGLYIYLLNAAAALIDSSSTVGLFIVEWIFHFTAFIFLFLIGRIYLGDSRRSLLFSVIMLIFYFCGGTYEGGNLTETFCLPLQIISLYLLARAFSGCEKRHRPVFMFVHGVCAAAAFFLRPNLTLMWVPLAAGIFLLMIIRREYSAAFLNLLFGVLGLAAASLPVLAYSLMTGCFGEMIDQTILFSFRYIENNSSLISNIISDALRPSTLHIYIFIIVSAAAVCLHKKTALSAKLIFCAMVLFSLAAVSMAGRSYGHYREYLIPFIIPAILLFTHFITKRAYSIYALAPMYLLSSALVLFNSGKFTDFFITGSEDKDRVEAWNRLKTDYSEEFESSSRMLVMGNMSVYYNVLEKLPEEKYFYLPDISRDVFPEPLDAQMNALKSAEYDVVFVPLIFEYYTSFDKALDHELYDALETSYEIWKTDHIMQVKIYKKKQGV